MPFERLVDSDVQFAAGVGHALRIVRQRKLVRTDDRLLHVLRQIEGGELAGGVRHDRAGVGDRRRAGGDDAAGAADGVGVANQKFPPMSLNSSPA
jgi:hypothetical protein